MILKACFLIFNTPIIFVAFICFSFKFISFKFNLTRLQYANQEIIFNIDVERPSFHKYSKTSFEDYFPMEIH